MASPMATRPWRTMTSGAIRQPSLSSAGTTALRTGAACDCTARADSPSAMTNTTSCSAACGASVASASGARRRPRSGRIRNSLPVGRGACHRQHHRVETGEVGEQPRLVERLVHGVAGAGVGELEAEQRRGRERRAAALQADARGGQSSQIGPQAVFAGHRLGAGSSLMRWPPAAARGSGPASRAGGCAPPCPSGPAAPAMPRTPARAACRAGRASPARRGTRCSDSRA